MFAFAVCNAIAETETDTRWSLAYGSFLPKTNGTTHMILYKLILLLNKADLKHYKRTSLQIAIVESSISLLIVI